MNILNGAIILAAGYGKRFNGKKQNIEFHGKPIWRYTYDLANQIISKDRLIVVGRDIKGGDTRSQSVINGLNALPRDTAKVIILEAARPLVTLRQINELLDDEHDSVTFVMPLVNTVIQRDGKYLNRNDLYELLTPQAFNYKLLLEAYKNGNFQDTTDETRVMYDYHGIKPFFIETEQNLFKLTYRRDIPILESLYQMQMRGEL